MLITNLSYVELFTLLRVRAVKLVEGIKQRSANRPAAVPVVTRPARNSRSAAPEPADDDDYIEDEENDIQLPSRAQPSLLAKVSGWFSGSARNEQHDETDEHEEGLPDVILTEPRNGPVISGLAGRGMPPEDLSENDFAEEDLEPVTPIIRDFFEHIRSEGLNAEDREEWSEFSPAARGGAVIGASDAALHGGAGNPAAADDPGENGLPVELDGLLGTAENGELIPLIPPPPPPKPYKLPSFRLLAKPNNGAKAGDQNDYMQTARKLEATLESFGVRAKVLEVVRGPAVTRYEIQPDIGVKVSRIVNLTDDIALALAAKDIR
ncbi:hypothetical protein KC345_g11901, partial [Hortaea werneckii]